MFKFGLFKRKSCYHCKFCYKVKKELTDGERKELGVLAESLEAKNDEPKVSDLNAEDLEDMYGLRQEYHVKCFKGQWDEDLHPELKVQSLKNRGCKYFIDRRRNSIKTYEQVEKEQMEKAGVAMHRESLEWMQISFLLGITSLVIGLVSRIPNIGEKLLNIIYKIRDLV